MWKHCGTADDLGYFDVGYRNRSVIKTPNIDKLAAEGVKLERHYAQPSCLPSRACLMMGRYQIHTGYRDECMNDTRYQRCMNHDIVTLPMKMKQNGYVTHMIGKWHLGNNNWDCLPNAKGFDTYFGYNAAAEDYYTHMLSGRQNCSDLWRDRMDVADKYIGQYSTRIFTEEAVNIIENHDISQPMFMYLAHQAVHAPLQVPQEYYSLYETTLNDVRRKYAAMVTCMDEGIGNVTEALKESGMWDNTVLVFVSDNGGELSAGGRNWPLRGGKGSVFEGGIRTVSFVTSSLIERPQRISNAMIHITDWFPTLTHLAGGTIDDEMVDGINMWDTISTGSVEPRTELLIKISPPARITEVGMDPWHKYDVFDAWLNSALFVGNWKLVTNEAYYGGYPVPPELVPRVRKETIAPPESKRGKLVWLFHIVEDRREKHDLSSQRPDVVFRMLEKLRQYQIHTLGCSTRYDHLNCNERGHRWGPPIGS
uniref:Arylsulfatase I-like n=1 Tax=Saccoglossus kowalevskii TaxID=10224 RepID=A0ABM0M5W5_SACKO|nr:PREDICTED: arylsulfatase I-like [Saccoglossus kowalevskii]